jgi:cell division protein FtsW (lipid II flippase)
MTLAAAVVLCMATTAALAYGAWRYPERFPRLATLAAVVVPFLTLALVLRNRPEARSGDAVQVIGQYAFLLDTVRIGAAPGADVRIPAPSSGRSGTGLVSVRFEPGDSSLVLRAGPGSPPVAANGRLLAAAPVGRSADLSLTRGVAGNRGAPAPVIVRVAMPWWPLGCTTRIPSLCGERIIDAPGVHVRTRVSENGTWSDAIDPALARLPGFVLFRRSGRVYVGAGGRTTLTLNGAALPAELRTAPGPVEIGIGRETARLRIVTDRRSNRMHILFGGRLVGDRWPLRAGDDRAVHRVSYGAPASPGTLPLIELSAFPLGARAAPYAGALEWAPGSWRWHADGRSRVVAAGETVLLPGTGAARDERGHLVRLTSGMGAEGSLSRVGLAWVLGALLLAAAAGVGTGPVPALRLGVLGLAYTLGMVRSAISVRVATSEPYNGEAVPTTLVFLVAFPVLVWLLERMRAWEWRSARDAGLARYRRLALDASVVVAAAAAVYALAGGLDRALFAAFIIVAGTAGLLVLESLLVPREVRSVAAGTPLGMFEIGAERGFSSRHLLRAVSTLLVLVVLYIALALSLRGVPPYLSMAAYTVVLAFVYVAAELRGRVWPRVSPSRHALIVRAIAALGAAGGALGALTVLGDRLALVIGAGVAGALAAALAARFVLAPLVGPIRLWPYRREDVLPPLWFAFAPVALLLVAQWSAVRRLGITLGFALAIAGLLLVVRVFAVLWHRETKERVDAHLRGTVPGSATRRRTPMFLLLALTVFGGYLGADRGLMLLLVTSVLATLVMATAMLGPKRLAVSVLALVVALGSIGAWLRVPPAELATRPMSLATPQVRYAAVRHPRALERQMLVARSGSAREIVSTLQQDWGMRAYASAGGTWGNGLYGTPYSRRAISEDVALTDNAFAVFVLSEHGFVGGAVVLAAYLALALLLLASATIAGRSVNEVPRGILLGGLAMYIAVPALYMAAANVSLLPLTGQNLPLLGLRSGADVAFASWTLALATLALPRASGASRGVTERAELNSRAMRRLTIILGAVAVVLVIVGVAVVRSLYRATHREVAPFQLAAFADGLRAAVERADIVQLGDSIVAGPAARGKLGYRDGDFVLATVERANAFASNRAEFRSHCSERSPWLRGDQSGVQVSDAPCKVDATVGSGSPWTGRLMAGATLAPADTTKRAGTVEVQSDIVLAAGAGGIVLAPDAGGVVRVSCEDTTVAFGAQADIACTRDARVRARRTAKGAVVDVIAAGAGITKNGNPLSSGERLRFGDVIAIDSTATWVVDATPRGALAYARERNGQSVRAVMLGTPALLARLDSLLAEGLQLRTRDAASDVALTVDRAAVDAMQRGLDRRCAEAASGGVRQCSAMLVDAETGDILALAGWARPGVRAGRFAPLDHNFRNHRAASTVKPFIAAAVLSEYPALRSLVVDHPGERFTSAAGWPLGSTTPMKSELHGCPRLPVAWSCFLPNSNNLYAVTLGFLGAAERGANGLPALGGSADGPGYAIDGRRMAQRPRFEMRNGRRVVAASPLARQLDALFDARIGRETGAFDQTLWRPLTERRLLRTSPQWQRVSPDVPTLPLDAPQFSDLRYLAGFLIGENENNWSNAALVRAMARVMNGRGTELRLVHHVGDSALPPVEKPGVRFGRGREDVLAGMRGVVRGRGTAARATATLFDAPGFDFFGKTGTLESQRFEPLSMFLFGGRDARVKPRGCPVVGIVYVESERGAAERLTGVSLFADVVAPVLRERYGWGDTSCVLVRPAPETP